MYKTGETRVFPIKRRNFSGERENFSGFPSSKAPVPGNPPGGWTLSPRGISTQFLPLLSRLTFLYKFCLDRGSPVFWAFEPPFAGPISRPRAGSHTKVFWPCEYCVFKVDSFIPDTGYLRSPDKSFHIFCSHGQLDENSQEASVPNRLCPGPWGTLVLHVHQQYQRLERY